MRRSGQRPGESFIASAKLTTYLLNVAHPQGGGKARFFAGQGFSPDRPEELGRALVSHALSNSWIETPSACGTLLSHSGPLETPSGKTPNVLSVWLDPANGGPTVLITAYPA